jgi:hypothetical protein
MALATTVTTLQQIFFMSRDVHQSTVECATASENIESSGGEPPDNMLNDPNAAGMF